MEVDFSLSLTQTSSISRVSSVYIAAMKAYVVATQLLK